MNLRNNLNIAFVVKTYSFNHKVCPDKGRGSDSITKLHKGKAPQYEGIDEFNSQNGYPIPSTIAKSFLL